MVNPLSRIPDLPSQASDTAKDVLSQLSEGVTPPIPSHEDHPHKEHELPPQASETAVSVLNQLMDGVSPPVPEHKEKTDEEPRIRSNSDIVDQENHPVRSRKARSLRHHVNFI